MPIEEIRQYKVGDKIFDTKEEAVLHETKNILQDQLDDKYHYLLKSLKTNKDLWEATINYCGALHHIHIHNPPRSDWIPQANKIVKTYTEEDLEFTIIPSKHTEEY